MVIQIVIALLVLGSILVAFTSHKGTTQVMTSARLDGLLVSSGAWTLADGGVGPSATNATCVAKPTVVTTGAGEYICEVTFATGAVVAKTVTVDGQGNWVATG